VSVYSHILRPIGSVRALLAGFILGGVAVSAADSATVVGVRETAVADLVVIGAGFDSGLRQGMNCRLSRGGEVVAEVVLAEVRPSSSTALIVSLAPRQAVRSGDLVSIKTLKTQT